MQVKGGQSEAHLLAKMTVVARSPVLTLVADTNAIITGGVVVTATVFFTCITCPAKVTLTLILGVTRAVPMYTAFIAPGGERK